MYHDYLVFAFLASLFRAAGKLDTFGVSSSSARTRFVGLRADLMESAPRAMSASNSIANTGSQTSMRLQHTAVNESIIGVWMLSHPARGALRALNQVITVNAELSQ